MSSHIVRDQDVLKLVYPLADLLGVRLGLHYMGTKGYEIVRIPGDKGLPFTLGPVTLNLPVEIKASYCSYPIGAIWVKILKQLYCYIVFDDTHRMIYCHIVNCDFLGGGTVELHAKFKGVHPYKVIDEIKKAGALRKVLARGVYSEKWMGWNPYGDESTEIDPVDTRQPAEDQSGPRGNDSPGKNNLFSPPPF